MKKILIALILLILSIGAVSANDNLTATSDTQKVYSHDSSDSLTGNEDLKSNGNESQDMIKSNGTNVLNFEISVPSEVVKGNRIILDYDNELYHEGNVKIYIDNELFDEIRPGAEMSALYEDSGNYDLGIHTCSAVYEGDGFYAPFNKTFEFKVVNVSIRLYEKMYIWDSIDFEASKGVTGTLTIRINNSTKSYNLNNRNEISYKLKNLKFGQTYDVEVSYSGNYGNLTKKQNLTIDYPFYLYENTFYGSSGTIFFQIPSDIKGKITAFIDGKDAKYDFNKDLIGDEFRPPNFYDGREFDFAPIYFRNLQIGNHTVTVNYLGDEKYPAKSITANITIHIRPEIGDYKIYNIGSPIQVTVTLAKGNVGTFSLYELKNSNRKLVECVNLTDGRATINYNPTSLGEYRLVAAYDTNHDHFEYMQPIEVSSVEFPYPYLDYYLNTNFPIRIALPNDAVGNYSIYVSKGIGEYKLFKSVKMKKGPVTFNFKTSQEDYYSFKVISDSNYGSEVRDEGFGFVDGSKITPLTSSVVYTDSGKITLKLYGQNGKLVGNNIAVNLKIAIANIKAKTDAKGSISIKIPKLKPAKYTITAKYGKSKVNAYLNVKHLLTLKTATVKKSAKKLTLQAALAKINGKYLKNKRITFKFNGKTYKANTNKKGVAKVTVKSDVLKKLKVGRNLSYQATYLKDTVRKTVMIKK